MSLETSKHSNHYQFYAFAFCRKTDLGIHYIHYCQSTAREQKSMSTPNVFKHYQFQEKQAQLLHQNQNYAFLCCFPLSICHSTSRNQRKECNGENFSIFLSKYQITRKNRQVHQTSSHCSLLLLQCNVSLLLFT